jgi:hypothetical protein
VAAYRAKAGAARFDSGPALWQGAGRIIIGAPRPVKTLNRMDVNETW